MWEKLDEVEKRYEELARELASPEVHSDRKRLADLTMEHKSLSQVVATY